MEGKIMFSVLVCILMVYAVAAEAPAAQTETGSDLKTAESSRFFSWGGGNRYPYYNSYPYYNWYHGSGYNYPNPNVNQNYPNTGYNYPNFGYPNYGFGNNGYFGGFPGGYSGGFPGGYSGYNGYSGVGNGYSRYRNNQDLQQQTTGRGGYIYKR